MAPPATRHPRWTLAVVCVATFMLMLDMTVVIVALSDIQADFGSSLASLQWVIDAYTLSLAGLLLTTATLGDRIGRRRVFLAGMTVFTLGSLACALAWSPLVLDLTRAAQGIGAALLFGVAVPLLADAFPEPRARAGAIGTFGAALATATAVGPLVGGALVDGPGWRWIFLINLPIGLAALVIGQLRIVESRAAITRAADWPGAALLTTGLLALLFALTRGNTDGWGSARILVLFTVAVALLAGFVLRQSRAAEPMLDLGLMRRPSFVGVSLSGWAISATMVAATTYLALYIVNTLGYSPFQTGLRFLPLSVASFMAAPIAARLVNRVPVRFIIGGGLTLAATGLWLGGHLHGDSRWTALLATLILGGLGLGTISAAMPQAALAAVPPQRAGMATGTISTMRQIGTAAGVAVLGALFQHRATATMATRLANSGRADGAIPPDQIHAITSAVGSGAGTRVADTAPPTLHAALATAARAATTDAINHIMMYSALVAAIAAVAAFLLIRPARPAPSTPNTPDPAQSSTAPARGLRADVR